jgi:hypothetical protein
MDKLKTRAKLVKLNFKVEEKQEEKTLCDGIMALLDGIDLNNLKLDAEFIKTIAELIENQINNKNKKEHEKIGKLELFVQIMKKLFPKLSEDELKTSINILELMLKQKLIKKVPLSRVICYYISKKIGQ